MTSAAILAGGHARRLGGLDKSQLLVDGRTILQRQLDAVSTTVKRVFLVGHRNESSPASGVQAIADRVPDCGPLGGLDAALLAAGEDHVLLLACDLPFISAALCRHLVSLSHGVDAVVPRSERGYHPLCAIYAQSCRAAVQRRLALGHLRMRELLEHVRVRAVDFAEISQFGQPERLLANINTPTDLDELSALSQ